MVVVEIVVRVERFRQEQALEMILASYFWRNWGRDFGLCLLIFAGAAVR